MKLYTEEQVREAYLEGWNDGQHDNVGYIDRVVFSLTPIELPSDEEIDEVAKDKIGLSNDCFGQYDFTSGKQDGFYEGAIWMRDKILNK